MDVQPVVARSRESKNLWKNKIVAAAYLYQQKAKPYVELLEATKEVFILDHTSNGSIWGCGSGRLIKSIWEKSQGQVASIIGIDISFAGLIYARDLIKSFRPPPSIGELTFFRQISTEL